MAKHLVVEEEAIFRSDGSYKSAEERVEVERVRICDELGVDLGKLSDRN